MAYQINSTADETGWDQKKFSEETQRLLQGEGPRFRRLWAYYRNPMRACGVSSADQGSDRPYRQAMEWGLPSRITGMRAGLEMFSVTQVDGVARKEVVIENDIGWRIDTIVDYLFGQPIVVNSTAPDAARRAIIEQLLRQILACNGGIVFLQQLALIGAVYGFVDVLVKFDCVGERTKDLGLRTKSDADSQSQSSLSPESSVLSPGGEAASSACGISDLGQPAPAESDHVTAAESVSGENDASSSAPGVSHPSPTALDRLARRVRLEIVEPARALPLCSAEDYRNMCAYAQVYQIARCNSGNAIAARRGLIERIKSRFTGNASIFGSAQADKTLVVELITPSTWQRYEDEALVAEGINSLGRVPLVHIQNTAIPMEYSGGSDVEPLIPVQDEINARLSDRAYRITMQSFKMYLGKGIENFTQMPVAPGRMWLTDNPDAEIIEFGGDGKTYSEDNHISEMREAMDKISGVTPIAAGALKGRIGHLTSAAALKVTMLALLAKTERKRTSYGMGIEQMCEMALAWLDMAGLFQTDPDERRIEINWPNPVPEDELERIQEAQAKVQLGVPGDVVLRELGY